MKLKGIPLSSFFFRACALICLFGLLSFVACGGPSPQESIQEPSTEFPSKPTQETTSETNRDETTTNESPGTTDSSEPLPKEPTPENINEPTTEPPPEPTTDTSESTTDASETTPETLREQAPENINESTPEVVNETSMESQPEKQPETNACAQEGESITTSKTNCCTGLKPIQKTTFPQCARTQQIVCTRCGNGTCDTKSGENLCNCPVDCGKTCKVRTDCRSYRISCSNQSNGCVQYGADCRNGRCVPAQLPPQRGTICNASRGECTRRCTRRTDCLNGRTYICQNSTQGCFLVSAQCVNNYCIYGTSIPKAGTACNTQTMQCINKNDLCRKTEDCFPNGKITYTCTTHPQGGCNKHTKRCYKGQCIRSSGRALGNLVCNPITRQCASKLCKKDCDCPQGQGCVKGACQTTTPRTYCCSKSGCPMGLSCSKADGTKASCPVPASCKEAKECGPSHCKNLDAKNCEEFIPTCDNGACKLQTGKKVTLSQCDHSTGRCKALPCKASGDCGKTVCRDVNQECIQETPTCANKACSLKVTRTPTSIAKCDASTGLCKDKVRCDRHSKCPKTACQDTDWNNCIQHRQQCSFTRSSYCKPWTYINKRNAEKCNTNTGVCEQLTCSSSKPCPRACNITNGFCVQKSSSCLRGRCYINREMKYDSNISKCNQTIGKCVCTNLNKECHPPECQNIKASGKPYCRQVTYTCKNGTCTSKSRLYGPNTYTCVSGLCKKK